MGLSPSAVRSLWLLGANVRNIHYISKPTCPGIDRRWLVGIKYWCSLDSPLTGPVVPDWGILTAKGPIAAIRALTPQELAHLESRLSQQPA